VINLRDAHHFGQRENAGGGPFFASSTETVATFQRDSDAHPISTLARITRYDRLK
jgi:hypothetical protein